MLRSRAPHKSFEHLGLHMTIFFQEHIKMQLYPLSFLEIRPRFLAPICVQQSIAELQGVYRNLQ